MVRKYLLKNSGLKADSHARAKQAVSGFAKKRKNGGIGTPFDQLKSAMSLGQVAEMPVIPALQVALVDHTQTEFPVEHPIEEAQVRNGDNDVRPRDRCQVPERFHWAGDMFQNMEAGYCIERFFPELPDRIFGI